MSRAKDLAELLDANGDVKSGHLDNVPPSNDASALTTGTLDASRLPTEIVSSDTTPALGGNLDVAGNQITNATSGGDITLSTSGTGNVKVTRGSNSASISGTALGFNRAVGDGEIYDSSMGAYQFNQDANKLALQVYNSAGTTVTANALVFDTNGQASIGGDPIGQSGLTVNQNSLSVKGSDGDWNQGGNRAFMDMAGGDARIGSVNGGGTAMGLNLYAGGFNSMGINSRGYAEIAKNSNSSGTGNWHVVREGDTVRCHKHFDAGASAANHNLFGMRRHYWGGGHFRINVRRSYYNDSSETIYFVDGNNRPGYSLSFPRHNENGDLGSGRIYEVSRTSSYPGDGTVSNYSIIGLNVPSYYQYEVILEFNAHNSGWRFDDAGISTAGNSWRLL